MDNRRQYLRIAREYRIEYGLFAGLFSDTAFQTTRSKNVSGSGVLFTAYEPLAIGCKIVLSIYVGGWKQENEAYIPCTDHGAELQLKAIAEVVRVEHDQLTGVYRTGARFVGRLQ